MFIESAELASRLGRQRRLGPRDRLWGLASGLWHGRRPPRSKTLELQDAQPETKRDDPKARALFDEVSKAYKALSSYSDQGEFVSP